MQLLPPLTQDLGVIAREKTAACHLPYVRHVDDTTLELAGGMLMQTIRLDGLLFETADTEEIEYRSGLRDRMLQAVASSHFAIYHHIFRRKAEAALEGKFADAFSRELDERWREKLHARQLYVNDLFVTIVRRPMPGKMGLLDRVRDFATGNGRDGSASLAANKQSLHAASDALLASLAGYGARLLSVRDTRLGPRSEPLEFLAYLYNADMQPLGLPSGLLSDHLPFRRASFGQNAFELGPTGRQPRKFGAIVSIKDYPSRSFAGMFDTLQRMPFEMTVSQSFAFVARGEALGRMNLALRRLRSTEDEALSLGHELTRAKDDVAAGRAAFGEHHLTLAIHAEDLRTLNGQVAEVVSALADLGIVSVQEDIALEPAFWAQFPGNFRYIGRRALISTKNFSSIASFHNFQIITARGN